MMTTTPSPLPPVDDLAAALMAGDPTYGVPSRVDLPDGRWLTMAVEPDDIDPLDDMGEGTWTGPVVAVERSSWSIHPEPRPGGFDGRARKLHVHDRGDYWWQVPDDIPAESVVEFGRSICDLLAYGYSYVVVKLHERVTDSTGGTHAVEVDWAALGGIEPFPDDAYLRDVAGDLIAEVLV